MSSLAFFAEPFYSLADFDSLFDQAFNARALGLPSSAVTRSPNENADAVPRPMRPRLDLHEDKEKNLVTATFELPGLTKENVQLDVKGHVLSVSGESSISNEREEKGYSVRERRFGKFSRSIPLPQGVKPDDIKASMADGLLTVTFPRTSAEQAPKKITIQ